MKAKCTDVKLNTWSVILDTNGTVELMKPSHRELDGKTVILIYRGVAVYLMDEHTIKPGV